MKKQVQAYFQTYSDAAPLAVFRIFFGLLMLASMIRFYANGWVQKLYLEPGFFFSYYGFEWVKPLGNFTYLIFFIAAVSALFVAIGFKYKFSVASLFLSFTYIELMDKTTYLNHYYFISLLIFLMFFLPANAYYSVDAWREEKLRARQVPSWSIDAIKLLICIVYFYAGLAKLNSDWLLHAMPLKIWLPSKYDLPLLGDFLQKEWVHYAMSWAGAIYDLSIPFLLLWRRTRMLGFALVVVFHALTRILFPIGMFPYIMIVNALIFFDSGLHHRILDFISRLFRINKSVFDRARERLQIPAIFCKLSLVVLTVFFVFQIMLPWRYLMYPGELFWTEEGFRFSWRVMLMEKAGYAQFKIVDPDTGRWFYVDNSDHLTPFQEKQMSFQPDFILEYAHHLGRHYQGEGIENPEVYVQSYVALNGRRSRVYVDPEVNLYIIDQSLGHQLWILPFDDEIEGI